MTCPNWTDLVPCTVVCAHLCTIALHFWLSLLSFRRASPTGDEVARSPSRPFLNDARFRQPGLHSFYDSNWYFLSPSFSSLLPWYTTAERSRARFVNSLDARVTPMRCRSRDPNALDRSAFLTAKSSNWQSVKLGPGNSKAQRAFMTRAFVQIQIV